MEDLGKWPENSSASATNGSSQGELHGKVSSTKDGSSKSTTRRSKRRPVTAIFIHAGAGFHSHANEKVHLEASSKAARMGMKFLQAGASATEAVTAAIKVLEDREVTNAGYGSNVNIEGMVECDATVVDHNGRSGACGAVPNIRNPVSLAKLILDKSIERLSMGRVPPNLLVGEGAREFGREHGMTPVSNESMISRNARDRFIRWREDLRRADPQAWRTKKIKEEHAPCGSSLRCQNGMNLGSADLPDHANAIATGVWNEGQPDSPESGAREGQSPVPDEESAGEAMLRGNLTTSIMNGSLSEHRLKRHRLVARTADDRVRALSDQPSIPDRTPNPPPHVDADDKNSARLSPPSADTNGQPADSQSIKRSFDKISGDGSPDEDHIIDTVGCIAIDDKGNIAAGSSSGGIGMKHRGRIGPAALVGVGTAVVPVHPSDSSGKSVACVMSGTGEHMATTMAAQRAAERIYKGTRQGPEGEDVPEDDDAAILNSFVAEDFMNHPSVMTMNTLGAIGLLTIKKCNDYVYFFFAHNTESFALASMASTDKEPLCLMSRLGGYAKDGNSHRCSVGARRVQLR